MMRTFLAAAMTLVIALPAVAGRDDDDHHRHLEQRVEHHREVLDDTPGDPAARRDLGQALYYLGVAADETDALKEAEAIFEKLHAADPDDPMAQAYLGSLLLKKTKRVWAPWKKGELSRQGIKLLDGAVASAPDDPHVRFVRAATTFHLPEGFERAAQSAADFAWLAEHAESHVASGALSPDLAAAALVRHATLRQQAGDPAGAQDAARRAAALAPESHAAWEAEQLLEKWSA